MRNLTSNSTPPISSQILTMIISQIKSPIVRMQTLKRVILMKARDRNTTKTKVEKQ